MVTEDLTRNAQLLALETGIIIRTDGAGNVILDIGVCGLPMRDLDAVEMIPLHAGILAKAIEETVEKAAEERR